MIVQVFPIGGLAGQIADLAILSVADLPFQQTVNTAGLSRRTLPAGGTLIEPMAIPFLPGMDDVEVASASLGFAGGVTDRSEPGTPLSGSTTDLKLTSPAGTAGALSRIEITGFRVTEPNRVLVGGAGVYRFDPVSGTFAIGPVDPNAARYLHFMLQALERSSAGPPIAAFPPFDMPGAGGDRYGPALGGGSLSLSTSASNEVTATLSITPALSGRAYRLLLGFVPGDGGKSPQGGLPNEVQGLTGWQAGRITATFRTRPEDVEITLRGPGTPQPASVASFPGETPGDRTDTDLTPALRAVARAALKAGGNGNDLGLQLEFTGSNEGDLLIAVPQPRLRYLRHPMPGPEELRLEGGVETLALALPRGLKPAGISFAIDGRYGPARVIDDAVHAPVAPRTGYRLVVGQRLAVPLALTRTESLLPLCRLAAFGRADEPGELLLSLFRGDGGAPATRYGDPVALPLVASARMDWHRGAWAKPLAAAMHPERLWVVAEVTHGSFLHAVTDAPVGALVSHDGGGSWSEAIGRPLALAWVDEVDPATGEPAPLHALDLCGPAGILNHDLAAVVGQYKPAAFALRWLATADTHPALMQLMADATADFPLRFVCRRDVRLTVSNATLIYDPWTARG